MFKLLQQNAEIKNLHYELLYGVSPKLSRALSKTVKELAGNIFS